MSGMKKILILYWPKGGSVNKCAEIMHSMLDTHEADLVELSEFDLSRIADYDLIIFGGSTVGSETWQEAMADDEWSPFFLRMVNEKVDLSTTKVALFGLGNQILYPHHFINGMRRTYDELKEFSPAFIGRWPSEHYTFTESDALDGDEFLGLPLDEDTESHMTESRIQKWLAQLLDEYTGE